MTMNYNEENSSIANLGELPKGVIKPKKKKKIKTALKKYAEETTDAK